MRCASGEELVFLALAPWSSLPRAVLALIEVDGPVVGRIVRMHHRLRVGRRQAPGSPVARGSSPRRALVAACIGNAVEWHDFALYGAFATILATTYFPSGDRDANLLAAFAVFSTAFVFRPVGAVLFGGRGDRSGRRQVLTLMIIVMSLATAGVGMLPGYASIGLLAPVLLILLRVAQGLSAGGEAGAASAFVVEYAPLHRRGWYGGWIWATLALGLAAATGTATLLARLPQAVLEAWAWRLAFLAALPVGLVGLYLRLRLDETPRFRAVQRSGAVAQWPVRDVLRAYPRQILVGLALVATASLTFNTSFIYLPNQLVAERGVPLSRSLGGALLGLVVMGAAAPALGRLSDQVGRRPLLAAATLGLLGLTLPIHLLIRQGGLVGLPLGYLVLGAALSCFVLPSFLSELFPTRVRSSGLAITYGLGSALFGGTAPFVDTLLVQRTGNPLVPAYYATTVALLAAIGVLLIGETAFRPLDADEIGVAERPDRNPGIG
jgi:MFS transporter, MHS family, proline/betaine transporter